MALLPSSKGGLIARAGQGVYCPNGHLVMIYLEDAYYGQAPWPEMRFVYRERKPGESFEEWAHCDVCDASFVTRDHEFDSWKFYRIE